MQEVYKSDFIVLQVTCMEAVTGQGQSHDKHLDTMSAVTIAEIIVPCNGLQGALSTALRCSFTECSVTLVVLGAFQLGCFLPLVFKSMFTSHAGAALSTIWLPNILWK